MLSDLRAGLRALRRQPGFTVVAVVTLALGLGATTALYAVVNAALLRPLPYPEPERLVRVYRTTAESHTAPHSIPAFLQLRRDSTSFEQLSAFYWRDLNFARPGEPAQRLRGIIATPELLPALRATPALGRLFSPEDAELGGPSVVVLSDDLWRSRFGADPGIVGQQLHLDGRPVTVIGVMAPGIDHRAVWGRVDVWQPMTFPIAGRADDMRWNRWLKMVGRLRPGVTMAAAQGELGALMANSARQFPVEIGGGARVVPLRSTGMDETTQRVTWLTLGLTGFVLLIVCANLAGVLMAKHAARGQELAVRAALGADRARLVRQLVTETLVLTALGGLLGLVVAGVVRDLLAARLMLADTPGVPLPLDGRVLAFAALVTLMTGLAFGVGPALLTTRPVSGVRGLAGQQRVRQALVIGQLALALVLLVGAVFFASGLRRYTRLDPGWKVDGLRAAELSLWGPKYGDWGDGSRRRVFIERLRQRLPSLPGLSESALSVDLPIDYFPAWDVLAVEGAPPPLPGQEPIALPEAVTPGYFAVLGLRLVEGRDFTSADGPASRRVVVINEAMARRLWPGKSPVGQRLRAASSEDWSEVVGVVSDVRFAGSLDDPPSRLQLYRPLLQAPSDWINVLMRGPASTRALEQALRAVVAELDPDLPVAVHSARDNVDRSLGNFIASGWALLAFAALGLVLAALGIYGLFSVFVAQRTAEIGVRVALGARTGDILWLVVGRGLRLALAGTALGVLGALAVSRVLAATASQLPPPQYPVIAALAALLMAVALLASWLPARRAAALDPMVALRSE